LLDENVDIPLGDFRKEMQIEEEDVNKIDQENKSK
jgi:hypothetical protein